MFPDTVRLGGTRVVLPGSGWMVLVGVGPPSMVKEMVVDSPITSVTVLPVACGPMMSEMMGGTAWEKGRGQRSVVA